MASNLTSLNYEQIFGKQLIKCTDNLIKVNTIDILKDESIIIGIYFTFLNIPNDFTKSLVNFYELINVQTKKFEIIQVILCSTTATTTGNVPQQNSQEFIKICQESIINLPWFAIPFSDLERKTRLSRKYNILTGMPTLILLNSDLTLITTMGRDRLVEDPEGNNFPWRPRPVQQILKDVQLMKGGFWDISHCDEKDTVYLKFGGRLIWAFYFSANWCPPCRAFTPQLLNTYQQIRKRGEQFEIIFVSNDRSDSSFSLYTETMPWLAVPYESEDIRKELTSLFGIQGIPTLVVLDENGKIITDDGRSEVLDDPDGLNFPWKPRPLNILTERYATKMHDFPAIILFIDGDDNELEFAHNVLEPIAKVYYKENDTLHHETDHQHRNVLFLIGTDSDTSDILREFVGLDDVIPLLAAVNIPKKKFSYLEYGIEITSQSVEQFVQKFLNNSLDMRDIRIHNSSKKFSSTIDPEKQ